MGDIFDAIRAKDIELLTTAVDEGAKLNDYGDEGMTPLGLASEEDYVEGIASLLGLAEIEANKGKKNGTSPLMIAARNGGEEAVATFLGFPSVDVNHANKNGNTALLLSIKFDKPNAFFALLTAPCIDIEKRNYEGVSPLLMACQMNKPALVEALLQKGADVTYMSVGEGEEPLVFYAVKGKFDSLINRMILNMARYKKTYNAPLSDTEVKPMAVLEGVAMDIYPLTAAGHAFLGGRDLSTPIPFHYHSLEKATAFKPRFKRMMDLVRGLCTGMDVNYAARKLEKIDFYVTLTYDRPKKLIGFFYVSLSPAEKEVYLDLICSRDTVKGSGGILMRVLIEMSTVAGYHTIALDSLEEAIPFYEHFDFVKEKLSEQDILDLVQPMTLALPGLVDAAMAKKTKKKRTAHRGTAAGVSRRLGRERNRQTRKQRRI
jgi:hypothetical protein